MKKLTPEDMRDLPGGWYLRISQDETKQDISNQRIEVRRWLNRHSLDVPKEHQFEDAEGYTPRHRPEDRPEWQRLVRAAEAGLLRWFVVTVQNRIGGKDPWQYAAMIYRFREAGCHVWTVSDELLSGNEALHAVQGVINASTSQKEQQDKARNVIQGQKRKALAGLWHGGYVPFGLDVVCLDANDRERWRVHWHGHYRRTRIYPDGTMEQFDGKGNFPAHERNERLVLRPGDRQRVEAVLMIFEWFATQAISTYQIAHRLNGLKIKPTYADSWTFTHVESILRNPAYIGMPAYNKQGQGDHMEDNGTEIVPVVPRPKGQKRRWRDSSAWVFPEKPIFDPIVSTKLFDKVQSKLNSKSRSARSPKAADLWLSGLVVCAGCGRPMRGQKRPHYMQYSCSTYDKSKSGLSGCKRNAVNQHVIEEYLEKYLTETGQTVEVLEQVQKTGDTSLLDTLVRDNEDGWSRYMGLFERLGQFIERHTEGKVRVPAVLLGDSWKPEVRSALEVGYRLVFSEAEADIRAEIERLQAVHGKHVENCFKLPVGSRALAAEQEKMLAVEERISALEADLVDQEGQIREAEENLRKTATLIREARSSLHSNGDMRERTQRLKGLVSKIVVSFEATGKKYPTTVPVAVEFVPVEGSTKKYRNLASG